MAKRCKTKKKYKDGGKLGNEKITSEEAAGEWKNQQTKDYIDYQQYLNALRSYNDTLAVEKKNRTWAGPDDAFLDPYKSKADLLPASAFADKYKDDKIKPIAFDKYDGFPYYQAPVKPMFKGEKPSKREAAPSKMKMKESSPLDQAYSRKEVKGLPYPNLPDVKLTTAAQYGYPVKGTNYGTINNIPATKEEIDEVMRKKQYNNSLSNNEYVMGGKLPSYQYGGMVDENGMPIYDHKQNKKDLISERAKKGAAIGAVGGTFLPGIGQIGGAAIGGATGLVSGLFGARKDKKEYEEALAEWEAEQEKLNAMEPDVVEPAPYAGPNAAPVTPEFIPTMNFAMGGKLPQYFMGGNMMENGGGIEYQGPSHSNGGIPVNGQGIPVPEEMATAEVQGGETALPGPDGTTVFSKDLKVKEGPYKGMSFADAHKEIMRKIEELND